MYNLKQVKQEVLNIKEDKIQVSFDFQFGVCGPFRSPKPHWTLTWLTFLTTLIKQT